MADFKIGTVGWFWRNTQNQIVYSSISEVDESDVPYCSEADHWYENFSPDFPPNFALLPPGKTLALVDLPPDLPKRGEVCYVWMNDYSMNAQAANLCYATGETKDGNPLFSGFPDTNTGSIYDYWQRVSDGLPEYMKGGESHD